MWKYKQYVIAFLIVVYVVLQIIAYSTENTKDDYLADQLKNILVKIATLDITNNSQNQSNDKNSYI